LEGNIAETIKYGKKIRVLGSINLLIIDTNVRLTINIPMAPDV
jgi:hypothetical protein